MRTIAILFLTFSFHLTFGQTKNEFERFNSLLEMDKATVDRVLQEQKDIKELEYDVKSPDSLRIFFRVKRPKQGLTFFFVNDTLKYYGISYHHISRSKIEKRLRDRFQEDDLKNLKGDIFENYTNDIHKAIRLFDNLKDGTGYLLVKYPEDNKQYARIVIWKRKKQESRV